MNLQQIFDRVKDYLIAQGKPSALIKEEDNGKHIYCRYRGPEGTKCAIGCLIEDSEYDDKIEGLGSSNCGVRTCLAKSGIPTDEETLKLLGQLQVAHDSAANHGLHYLETVKGLLDSVASDFKLEYKA